MAYNVGLQAFNSVYLVPFCGPNLVPNSTKNQPTPFLSFSLYIALINYYLLYGFLVGRV